jgi:hypothetical protein
VEQILQLPVRRVRVQDNQRHLHPPQGEAATLQYLSMAPATLHFLPMVVHSSSQLLRSRRAVSGSHLSTLHLVQCPDKPKLEAVVVVNLRSYLLRSTLSFLVM